MRFPLWLPAALFGASLGLPARADLAGYRSALKRFPPQAAATPSALKADPARWKNAVVEIKGTVAGVSRSEDATSLLVRDAGGDMAFIRASQGTEFPLNGDSVRALVTFEGPGRYSLLSVITEAEVGDAVLDAPKPAPKPAAKGKQVASLPTRWPSASLKRSSVSSRLGVDPRIMDMYKGVIQRFNPRLSDGQSAVMARSIVDSSYAMGVDARLIMAIFATESAFKVNARSRVGAMGIGQLMPGTARSLGVANAYDPEQNILGAVRLIQKHWVTYAAKGYDFGKVFSLVCAAYNAGPGAVKKYGGVPPYRETRTYVKRVAKWYSVFAPELFEKS